MSCRKQRFDSQGAALAVARKIAKNSSPRGPKTYRCADGCKKANGQRAWHWANYRPAGRR